MTVSNSDWSLRGPVTTKVDACAVDWSCIDLISRTKVRGTKTFTYCGTGKKARLLSVSDPARSPGTATLRGPEADVIDILQDFDNADCPLWFQLVSCDGDVKHFSGVYLGDSNAVNALSANGPDATASALIEDVSLQFERITYIRPANKTGLGTVLTTDGYNELEEPVGLVNGVNVYYKLAYTPLDGYPIDVYIDGVLQLTGYTINGRNITFDTAPACDQVITVTYYDQRYAYYGLCPVAVVFCEDDCTSGSCEDCGSVYALFQSAEPADPDVCGNIEGYKTVLARFDFDDGDVTFNSVEVHEAIINPTDMVCGANGRLLIAAENGMFEGCDGEFTQVRATNLPSTVTVRALAYDDSTEFVYGLYGNSGVVYRNRTDSWNVLLRDGTLTTSYQNAIDAQDTTVVTVGVANSVQMAEANSGQTFELLDGPETIAYDLLEVAIGPNNNPDDNRVVIYTLSTDNTSTYIYSSGNFGATWGSALKSWNFVPTNTPQIEVFEDWLVYVQIGDETWRNTNRGCDRCGAWEELLDSGYACSHMTFCEDDPNSIMVIQQPLLAAVPDFLLMDGTTLNLTDTISVTANDLFGEGNYDGTSLTIVSNSAAGEVGATVSDAATGTIQIEVLAVPLTSNVAYIVYRATSTTGEVLTGLLTVDFLA